MKVEEYAYYIFHQRFLANASIAYSTKRWIAWTYLSSGELYDKGS